MIKRVQTFIVTVSVLFLGAVSTLGQEQITFFKICGNDFNAPDDLPETFPGFFYATLRNQTGVGIAPYLISDSGLSAIQIPTTVSGQDPILSPDGQLIALRPAYPSSNDLFVWNANSGEVASISLLDEIASYLVENERRYVTYPMRLQWTDSDQLVIKYFPGGNPRHLTELIINLDRDPLQLELMQDQQNFANSISEPAPAIRVFESPTGTYYIETENSTAPRVNFRVFTKESNSLLYVEQSEDTATFIGNPLWLNTDDTLVYLRLTLDSPDQAEVIEVDVPSGFKVEAGLGSLIQREFGAADVFSTFLTPAISDDQRYIAFFARDRQTSNLNSGYIVRYSPAENEVIAVCSGELPSGAYADFSPDGQYLVIVGGITIIYDFITGNRYTLNALEYGGWAVSPDVER